MATRKPRRPRPQKAVIDRVEDGKWAVLLVGRNELEKIVPVDHLPEGARAGSWLKVRMEDDQVSDIAVDDAETRAAQQRVSSKLEKLRQRGAHFKPVPASEVQDGSNTLHNPPARPESAESSAHHDEASRPKGAAKLLSGPVKNVQEVETPTPPTDSSDAQAAPDTPAEDDA